MAANFTANGQQGGIAFGFTPNGGQANIATSATTVAFATEIYDQGNNFASNVFTAPVDGKYLLCCSIYANHLDTDADFVEMKIVTSNRNFSVVYDMGVVNSDPVYWHWSNSVVAEMDASDTALIKMNQGGGAAQMDLEGSVSNFSGCLIA